MQDSNTSGIHRIYRLDNQPFAQIPNEAIRNPQITATGFRLLAYLMSHQDGYELTYGQIERETGMGRYAINEAINNLERHGWLRTERTKMPNGQFGPKAWFVMNPYLPTTVGNSTAGNSIVEEPTDNKNTTSLEHNKKRTVNAQQVAPLFLEFWQVYPLKKGKQAAWKAFEKALGRVPASVVLDGVKAFAQDPYLPPKQFLPYPATWLNEDRWEDEPYPVRELTAEEKQARAKAKADADRAAALAENARQRAESEKAKASAVPAPKCVHGKSIVLCVPCLKNVASSN